MAKTEKALTGGLTVKRFFTKDGVHPYDDVRWDVRDAVIPNFKEGGNAFEQREVEFPASWSQNATNIVAQKYFRGPLGTPQREHSVRQLIDRVADTLSNWGWKDGYFASESDRDTFNHELKHILVTQKASFNSPVWFNVGVEAQAQGSACFILAVEDKMSSILNWYVEEGTIFKGGSGSGINLSNIRSSKEQLSSGGEASGPVSFMRGADASAGTIKSGGKCFRRGTLVATPEGWRPVESLNVGELVLTHQGPRPVLDFMANGVKQCYRVRTREGYEVEVTSHHKFAFWDVEEGVYKVKPIEEFALGDPLYLLIEPSHEGVDVLLRPPDVQDPRHATTTAEMDFPTELDEKLGYFLGLVYGDGELRTEYPYRVRVSFAKDEAGYLSAERFRKYGLRLFGEEPIILGDYPGYQVLGYTRKRLVEFLVANDIAKGTAEALVFPRSMFQARPEVRAAFVAGIIDADGTYQARGGWSISCIDRGFLLELQRLLLSLGVPSKIKLNREGRGTWKPLYRLSVVGHTFVKRLTEWIGRHSAKAAFNYIASPGADKGWGYRPPLYRPLRSRASRGAGTLLERTLGDNETTGYGALVRLKSHPTEEVAGYAETLTHCVQVRLEAVEPTVEDETYDIEVEGVHLLSANGLYASNTRRAAKMVVLNVDHPDVEDFIWCKAVEEKKARALRDAGFDMDLDGRDAYSIQYQNANNSVRVTDEFMKAVEEDRDWALKAVLTGEPLSVIRARDLMRQIAEAAWECADPGTQYDTTINNWHTSPASGRINASNPCSEYMSLDNSACNLASLNLLKFVGADGNFDIAAFRHAIDIVFLGQEIIVGNSSYPTEKIGKTAVDYRQLGLGYANLGALLMSRGLAYDSKAGRAWAGAITALMTGWAYRDSALFAEKIGPFNGYAPNREPMLNVMRKHRAAVDRIDPDLVPEAMLTAAKTAWDEAIVLGSQHGYRNSQASVLAPTGTIGLMMDCDTTGVEPDLALVKTKKLVGGGTMKIVNQTVPRALERLGYSPTEVEQITAYIHEHNTVDGAPYIKDEHRSVFDCAMGQNPIHYMGHVNMMAAVQPFISGAISKTVNMPESVTVEEVENLFIEGWKLGLKALAIYRDNCKVAQPLSADKKAPAKVDPAVIGTGQPQRRRLPKSRPGRTVSFRVADTEGYMTAGEYPDDGLGEIFLKVSKQGSTLSGIMDAFAISLSLGLQYGVPLEAYIAKFMNMRFEPAGMTDDPDVRLATSVVDYVFRRLALDYLDEPTRRRLGIMSNEERRELVKGENGNGSGNGHGEASEGPAAHAAAAPVVAPPEPIQITPAPETRPGAADQVRYADAPYCYNCGNKMQPAGSCFVCESCGSTSGCS